MDEIKLTIVGIALHSSEGASQSQSQQHVVSINNNGILGPEWSLRGVSLYQIRVL